MIIHALALTTALTLGYTIARIRPGERMTNWAYRTTDLGRHAWKFWIVVPILLTALAWDWTIHHRRTLTNLRLWRHTTETR
ncbi:hypothetical protein AB0958_18985 [Streptomyces sp. NPDC006655]|uniref:hypothetical protein n=1 Tax=Streptomyces sp. NPDC006655 TaxID=3156898 RepID=UPI003455FA5A